MWIRSTNEKVGAGIPADIPRNAEHLWDPTFKIDTSPGMGARPFMIKKIM